MSGFQELPLVDMGQAEGLAARLDQVFRQAGFCYLTGHGIAAELCDGVLDANRRFHALPLADKEAVAINRFHRGYSGFASSKIVTSSVERAKKPNQSESFLMLHELAPDHPARLAERPLQGPNQWPQNLPGFKDAVVAYNGALHDLALRLVALLGQALGADLTCQFTEPTTFLRLIHYPRLAAPLEPGLYGSSPHTDHGFITLLLQDETGGLAVLNDTDQWIDAPPRPDSFLVNIGDMAMRWSNGRWRSSRHRVINRAARDRYSVPFFFDPGMDTIVQPLGPEPPRYRPVRYGDYLMERLDANYGYRQKETA